MANQKVIGDYTAANSIDGSTHYLLIQPGSSSTAYNKINRNVFLGVTGQPVDISTSQTLSNKTIGNTNTVTALDSGFTLQDNSDNTKQAQFQLSGLTTATTRTYTLPDASSTLMDISSTQTATNKTFTAPVISGGSMDMTTITVDSIAGHTSATSGTIYGLSIASGKVGTNGVVTVSLTDSSVTPAKLQSGTGSGWATQSWTPTLSNITVGNGTLTSHYIQTGKTVYFYFKLIFGSTSSLGSGTDAIFSLPVTTVGNYSLFMALGQATFWDNSATTAFQGVVAWDSTTQGIFQVYTAGSTYVATDAVNSAKPMTWAVNDILWCQGSYEAA